MLMLLVLTPREVTIALVKMDMPVMERTALVTRKISSSRFIKIKIFKEPTLES